MVPDVSKERIAIIFEGQEFESRKAKKIFLFSKTSISAAGIIQPPVGPVQPPLGPIQPPVGPVQPPVGPIQPHVLCVQAVLSLG